MATKGKSEIIPSREEYGSDGQSKTISFTYTWELPLNTNNAESPLLSTEFDEKHTLYLKIEHKKLFLCLLPCTIPKMTVNYAMSIAGTVVRKSSVQFVSSENVTVYDCGSVPYSLKLYTVNYIDCSVELVIPIETAAIEVPNCQLLDNLENLIGDVKSSDVTIIVSEHKFFAHKLILAMRSRVFSAMFDHKMAENLENLVEITDMEPEVCSEMLHYIYTGQAPNIKIMAEKLLMAAEKYDLERLKAMCSEIIRVNLTIENAANTLIFAGLYNATLLKTRTADFISTNLAAVFETNGYRKMIETHVKLVPEIINAVVMRQKSVANKSMVYKNLQKYH